MSPYTRSQRRRALATLLQTENSCPLFDLPSETRFGILQLIFSSVTCYFQSRYTRSDVRWRRVGASKAVTLDPLGHYFIWATGSCAILFASRQCFSEGLLVAHQAMTYDVSRTIGFPGHLGVLDSIWAFSGGRARHIYGIDSQPIVSSSMTRPLRTPLISQLYTMTLSVPIITVTTGPSDTSFGNRRTLDIVLGYYYQIRPYFLDSQAYDIWLVGDIRIPGHEGPNKQYTERRYIVSIFLMLTRLPTYEC